MIHERCRKNILPGNIIFEKNSQIRFHKNGEIIDKHLNLQIGYFQRLFGVIIVNLITELEGGLFHYYGAEVHIPEANCKVELQSSNCLPSK